MSDVESYAKDLVKISKATKEFSATIATACGGSLNYGIDKVVESYLSMYDRFCPFKEGDRVMLCKTPDLSNAPGWQHCSHFLKRGAGAAVCSRGYHNGKFTFQIIFDDESWVNSHTGTETPVEVDKRHQFRFSEDDLIREDGFERYILHQDR